MNAVIVKSLSVAYPGGAGQVIDALDLTVKSGEAFGLLGPSGCGKSTLLRVLGGVNRTWQGHIRVLDREPMPQRRFDTDLRRKVQLVFQDPYASLHPRHTIERTLLEPLRVNGVYEPRERLNQALDEVSLSPVIAHRYPHELSGGQRQRVAIARPLLLRPALLLLDEPTAALDMSVQAEILNLLNLVKARYGMTLVLVSHDRDVVGHLCDRAAVMHAGRIERILGRDELGRPAEPG